MPYLNFMFRDIQKGKKIVILSATSDLSGDQRLHKVAVSLQKIGFIPILVGFRLKSSLRIANRTYECRRFRMLFKKGPLFYSEFNLRLFFYLLFNKLTVLVSNDLDTLLANFLVYKIKHFINKKIKIVYDSHELFTELPELNGRPKTREVWLAIEKWTLPKIKNAITVCEPIAEYYFKKYNVKMHVIKNMPLCNQSIQNNIGLNIELPENKKIILYQGALNIGRGIEQVIDLMEYIENAVFVIAGSGTIEKLLKQRVSEKKLIDKIIFTGKIPFEKLIHLTKKANVGLVLQEDISLSYRYVLPNRLFDFINAGVPVLASALPEIRRIVEAENIGLIVNDLNESELMQKIKSLLDDQILIEKTKKAILNCKSKYCWENEEKKLEDLYLKLE
jgi:glycosyltransferase involved in cell wall biosynthesis